MSPELPIHADIGARTYGLYVVYHLHKFDDDSRFVKLTLDYGCEWAEGSTSENLVRSNLMTNGFDAHYTWNGDCHMLSSDLVRLLKCLGVQGSLRRWARNATESTAALHDMVLQRTVAIDPVGDTWGMGPIEWVYHQWAESGGDQYDPSANATFDGTWGGYEDELFSHYHRCIEAPPRDPIRRFAWDENQPGQTGGCESRGIPTTPTMLDWRGPDR